MKDKNTLEGEYFSVTTEYAPFVVGKKRISLHFIGDGEIRDISVVEDAIESIQKMEEELHLIKQRINS